VSVQNEATEAQEWQQRNATMPLFSTPHRLRLPPQDFFHGGIIPP